MKEAAGALLRGKKVPKSRRNIRAGHACHILRRRSIDFSFFRGFYDDDGDEVGQMKRVASSGRRWMRSVSRAHRFVADDNSGSRLL